jgi:acetyl-CoA acetyltransferase
MSPTGPAQIIGIGATAQGQFPGRSANELALEAIGLALDDAGIAKSDVDGLITCQNVFAHEGIDEQIGQLAGLNPQYAATLDYGTGNFSLHLGAMAIATGLASVVVLCYGTNQRSDRKNFGMVIPIWAALGPVEGFVGVAGPAAMAFRRHQHLYGTTEEQLGWVAIAQREWARLNPNAIFQTPLSISDYLQQDYLVEPLRRADLPMVSDGGVAIVLAAEGRNGDHRHPPVEIAAMVQQTSLRADQNPDNLMRFWLADMGERLWDKSGMTSGHMDLAYLQDGTSVWVLQMLERMGFCKPGEAGPFVADGNTRPGGSLPVNTGGGHLSESYMWGWLHIYEAVLQLRGDAGARQVEGAEFALNCSTHDFLKGAATILRRAE